MKTGNQILIVSIAFIVAACSPGTSFAPTAAVEAPTQTPLMLAATPTPAPTATSQPDRLNWMLTTPANPINLNVNLDDSRGVEAVISPDGGKLEATGADGTQYRLDLPAGSVVMDTTIRMTPVKAVSGLPLQQSDTAWAVQLEPDGLQLLANASLTIQFPSPPPVLQQVPFQYQGSGQAFNLAAPVVNAAVDTGVDAQGIQLDIAHFSGYGVAKGYLAELEPVRQRLGGSVEDRLTAEIARLLAIERQKQLVGSSDDGVLVLDSEALKQLWDQYFNEVIPSRIEAAKTDCAAGRLVLRTWLMMERMRQLLGTAGLDAGEPFPLPDGFADMVTKQCMQEEYEMCRDQHIIHRMVPLALGLLRQQALLGSENPHLSQEVLQLVQKCLTFELDFDSTGKEIHDFPGGVQINNIVTVKAEIPVQWKPDAMLTMDGDGPLEVTQYNPEIIPSDFCKIVSKDSHDGQFFVQNLIIHHSLTLEADGIPKTDGLVMDYTIAGVEEKWSDECIKNGSLYWSYAGTWGLAYLTAYGVLHQPESYPLVELPLTPHTFRATAWTLGSGELVASMEWKLSGDDPAMPGVSYEESGTFKLYHKPK